jgi:hypothetical protein
MLRALLDGQTDPWERAPLARGSLRGKPIQLAQAMVGTVKEHPRFLLLQHLALIDVLDRQVADLDQAIAHRIAQDGERAEPTGAGVCVESEQDGQPETPESELAPQQQNRSQPREGFSTGEVLASERGAQPVEVSRHALEG